MKSQEAVLEWLLAYFLTSGLFVQSYFLSLAFIFFLSVKMIQVSFLYASYKTLETCKDIGKIVLKFPLLETDKHCDVKNCLLKHFKMRAKMVPDACLGDECDLQFG